MSSHLSPKLNGKNPGSIRRAPPGLARSVTGITKNRLCAIPERMGPVLAAETDMHKVIALLKSEMEGALLSLSEDFLAAAKEAH